MQELETWLTSQLSGTTTDSWFWMAEQQDRCYLRWRMHRGKRSQDCTTAKMKEWRQKQIRPPNAGTGDKSSTGNVRIHWRGRQECRLQHCSVGEESVAEQLRGKGHFSSCLINWRMNGQHQIKQNFLVFLSIYVQGCFTDGVGIGKNWCWEP